MELGVYVEFVLGFSFKVFKDVVFYFMNVFENFVLFIDEIYCIVKVVEEYFYMVMEDFCIDLVLGEGINVCIYSLKFNLFMFIGVIIWVGLLFNLMCDCFLIWEYFDFYIDEEFVEIVFKNVVKLKIELV